MNAVPILGRRACANSVGPDQTRLQTESEDLIRRVIKIPGCTRSHVDNVVPRLI